MSPAEWRDTPLGFHLAKAGAVRCNGDIAGEHHLNADGVGDALVPR